MFRLLLSVGVAFLALCARGDDALPWPDGSPQQVREDVFGVRFRAIREFDGEKAGLEFLRREFARDPKPEVKAYMGWICIFAKGWGYPEMLDEQKGLKLATQAMNEGSVVGCDVLARAMGFDIGGKSVPFVTARMLQLASDGRATRSMARLGVYYAFGYGVPQNWAIANALVRRAAELGQPMGLTEIGDAFAEGKLGDKPDQVRALDYYYEASCHADTDAWKKLKALGEKGVREGKLYYALGYVREANRASWTPPSLAKVQLKVLTELAGDHPQALVEIGRAHLDGDFAKRDYAQARDCFTRAAAQGNEEAKFWLADMQLRGWGEKAQVAEAMAKIQALADAGVAEAANDLGYLYYWGTKEVSGMQQDKAKTFHYIRLAAEKGNPTALVNLGRCYEDGIGTPQNYALAVKVYWQAYLRGYNEGRDRVRRLLPFIK
jgi:uncharacterized protein